MRQSLSMACLPRAGHACGWACRTFLHVAGAGGGHLLPLPASSEPLLVSWGLPPEPSRPLCWSGVWAGGPTAPTSVQRSPGRSGPTAACSGQSQGRPGSVWQKGQAGLFGPGQRQLLSHIFQGHRGPVICEAGWQLPPGPLGRCVSGWAVGRGLSGCHPRHGAETVRREHRENIPLKLLCVQRKAWLAASGRALSCPLALTHTLFSSRTPAPGAAAVAASASLWSPRCPRRRRGARPSPPTCSAPPTPLASHLAPWCRTPASHH